jgi:hypothetical protein
MSSEHQMQTNRFEFKYIVSERCARALRDFARSYLVPDEHADVNNNYSYAIHSLYLDGPGLPLYNATVHGHKNRFKLRIRYYDDRPENPVFFEIKRRVNDVILKARAMVKRSSVARLVGGGWPEMSDLSREGDLKSFDALNRYCELQEKIHGSGRCIVSYIREAWVTANDNSVRMTFDRAITSTPWNGTLVVADFLCGVRPPIPGAVLELKFTNRFPLWMRDMVRIFNLPRMSMAKYVNCIQALHPQEAQLTDLARIGAVI